MATPVWITGSHGGYTFTTGDKAWKTRRLLHNPSVRVQVCDLRGRAKPGATIYEGVGTVKTSAESVAVVESALAAKYGWQFQATKLVDGLKARFARAAKQDVVAIELSLRPGRTD